MTLKLLFVNNNRFINVSNDECCVPKCKLKRLEPSAARSESKLKTVGYSVTADMMSVRLQPVI